MVKVILREWRRLLTRPIYLFCIFVVPLLCAGLLTTLMGEGLPSNMPVGLVDEDHTATTRGIARNLDAFQNTRIVASYPSVTAARKAMQRGEIYAFYHLPQGTTRQLLHQQQPHVAFYTNNTFLMAGSLLYKDMRTMSELASGAATRTALTARGASDAQAMAFLQPIAVDAHPVGNPSLNYNVYLSNILLPGMLSLMIFFVTVFSIGTEIKESRGRALLVHTHDVAWKALWGKLLAQTALFLPVAWALGTYLYGYLHFPCHCGLPTMLLLLSLFVVASQGLGVLMICALPNPRFGLSFASLWGVLSFSICGMSFPAMAMHPVLHGVSYLFPLRHYYLLYVNCALDGWPLSSAWPFVAALCGFALLPWLFTTRFRTIITRIQYLP